MELNVVLVVRRKARKINMLACEIIDSYWCLVNLQSDQHLYTQYMVFCIPPNLDRFCRQHRISRQPFSLS
jgi:hypothetical protein